MDNDITIHGYPKPAPQPKPDGGPAFPHLERNFVLGFTADVPRGGMSLRQWFAGKALAVVANYSITTDEGGTRAEQVSAKAYEIADAMLSERSK